MTIASPLGCELRQVWNIAMATVAAVGVGIGVDVGVKKPLFAKEEKL